MKHFIKIELINFTPLRDQVLEEQSEEDASYKNVLDELGIDYGPDVSRVPFCDLPLFLTIFDIDSIQGISRLTKPDTGGFTQIDYKDGSRSYAKVEFENMESVLAEVGKIHIP